MRTVSRLPGPVRRPGRGLSGQVLRFAAVGALSTVLHLSLFAVLSGVTGTGAQVANVVALLLATVANTAANRRWTFGVRGPDAVVRHHVQSLAVLGLTFVTSAAGLAVLHTVAPAAGTGTKTATIAVANLVATAVRFVAMRSWIFRPAAR